MRQKKALSRELKNGTPIRTFANWDEKMPGFFEVDLVSDEGGPLRGDFIHNSVWGQMYLFVV